MRTDNWCLTQDYTYGNWTETKILPGGSYVKPIDDIYVPNYVKERVENTFHTRGKDAYCYTQHGIVSIPWRYLQVR